MKIDVDWMYNQLALLGWIRNDSHNKSTLDVIRSIFEQNTWVTVFAIRGWVIDRELDSTFPTCFIQRQMRNTCCVQVIKMWSLGNSSWRATRIRVFSVGESPFGNALRLEAKRRRINIVSDAWKSILPIFAVARWKISMLFTNSEKEEKRRCFHPHPNHRYHDT